MEIVSAVLTNTRPVSDYRCKECGQAAWAVYPRDKPIQSRIQRVHVTHLIDCWVGKWKETMGFPRDL